MTNVKQEVVEILSRSNIAENLLILPPEQLERKLYQDVAKTIELAGGKWNRSKAGFVFQSDPREKLGMAVQTGKIVNEKKERQAFYTPEAIADEIAILAGVAGMSVLEPSAGDGNLAKACIKFGAKIVHCIEREESCKENLYEISDSVVLADFLSVPPITKVDRVIMNPPFAKRQYVKHVAHAIKFLNKGGSLYAIVPNNNCQKLKDLGCYVLKEFPTGSFKESGTMVSTVLVCYEN